MTSSFEHLRHKPASHAQTQAELILACAPMRSHINLSRIVRAAGCFGIPRVLVTGPARVDRKIARDGAESVMIEPHRTLLPALKKLRQEGFDLVGLEQTTNSESLFGFPFKTRTCLVIGNERQGITDDILAVLDRVAEIPIYGMPHSHNVASATIMAMYEYARFRAAKAPKS